MPCIPVTDLGRMPYSEAYAVQLAHHDRVLAARETDGPHAHLLLVEHAPPVITISRRTDARHHLLASPAMLERAGVTVAETDRGGDITYHGPGQLVVYPIVDLNFHGLGLHDYMRLLEASVIDACAAFGLATVRDPTATGVWTSGGRKVCAMGVRVRRWVTLHGLAINVTTNLDHFRLIVPCGLAGREVTSLEHELPHPPTIQQVKDALVRTLTARLSGTTERKPR